MYASCGIADGIIMSRTFIGFKIYKYIFISLKCKYASITHENSRVDRLNDDGDMVVRSVKIH